MSASDGRVSSDLLKSVAQKAIQTAMRTDSWVNAITGLGGVKDKLTHLAVQIRGRTINDDQLDQLYVSDDLAARMVDTVPDEMLRQGYKIQIGEEGSGEDAADLVEKCSELEIDENLIKVMKWARLYGAACLIMGADDGLDPREPLDETRIESFDFVNIADARDITILEYYRDPYKPKFGKPKLYQITHTGAYGGSGLTVVHESRIILFEGPETPWRKKTHNRGFNFSVLERTSDVLKEFHTTWKSSAHLMSDMSQGVVSIDGLMAMIAGGQKDVLMDRIELMDMSRSVARLMLLDADKERFERTATPINGVADILELAMIRVSASCNPPIPVSILFGQDPAGMNSSGDMQVRRFYDGIRSAQMKDLLPKHRRLLRLIMLAKNGPMAGQEPDNWTIEYNSLWQMTEEEKANLRLTTAQADQIEIDAGILLVDEVALGRHTLDGYNSGALKIDRDLRKATYEEAKAEVRSGKTAEPPAAPV